MKSLSNYQRLISYAQCPINEVTAKKYKNLGYNDAALTFIEAGNDNIKNPDCKVMDAVIAVSPNNKLLLPCYYFVQTGVLIRESPTLQASCPSGYQRSQASV
ncbi:MAG: hypothetical protein V7K50_13775 [Nostoc sp.]|uniref:hypothetical protein n=1 Tax=Nostoc sp. TaxID=1180 RepID=UPI002FF6573B